MPSLNVITSLVDEVLEMSQFPLSIRNPDLVFLFNCLDPVAIITKKIPCVIYNQASYDTAIPLTARNATETRVQDDAHVKLSQSGETAKLPKNNRRSVFYIYHVIESLSQCRSLTTVATLALLPSLLLLSLMS